MRALIYLIIVIQEKKETILIVFSFLYVNRLFIENFLFFSFNHSKPEALVCQCDFWWTHAFILYDVNWVIIACLRTNITESKRYSPFILMIILSIHFIMTHSNIRAINSKKKTKLSFFHQKCSNQLRLLSFEWTDKELWIINFCD